MRRHLLLALALLSLFAVSLAVSDRTTDRSGAFAPAPPKPPAKPQAPSALAKVKNIANNVVNNVKKLIAGARAGVKKEIDGVKLYLKKKWKDAQQLYQYTRYCLNHRAPKKLKLKLPNSALCSTVKKAHPIFTTAIEKIVSRIPVPSLKQTIAAELVGERQPRPQPQRRRPGHSALLEVGSHNPGSPTLKWPSSLISYALSPDLDPAAVVNFQWGVNHIEAMTCIRFQQIEFNVTGDGIQVIPSTTMCAAIVGYQGPENQNLWWGPDCAPGSAVHELLHALGFDHTQNRLDRDLYLQVDMARIQPENQHNFEKRSLPFQDYGPYDFMSILHYPNNAFSLKDDDPGMVEVVERPESTPPALNSPWNGDAQRDSMTEGDVAAVAAIYSC